MIFSDRLIIKFNWWCYDHSVNSKDQTVAVPVSVCSKISIALEGIAQIYLPLFAHLSGGEIHKKTKTKIQILTQSRQTQAAAECIRCPNPSAEIQKKIKKRQIQTTQRHNNCIRCRNSTPSPPPTPCKPLLSAEPGCS